MSEIRRPDDFHVHFRGGGVMASVVPCTARHFARALVMPNVPAIETASQAVEYRDAIEVAAGGLNFQPLMTIKLTHRTTPETVAVAKASGVVAAKLYPEGATTASHDGIREPLAESMHDVYRAMAELGMVLCIHGEEPSEFVLCREDRYRHVVRKIYEAHPDLRIVLEHITTSGSVDFVRSGPENLAATITAHHLIHTLDDVIGNGLRPHHFCYPVPKSPLDRKTLGVAALGEHGPRFFFGSDSAPHLRSAKESPCGCAGVFSAPVAMSVLADFFLRDTSTPYRVGRLQAFTSECGADFYGLPRNDGVIRLVRRDWEVPNLIGGVVPLMAGETVGWDAESAGTEDLSEAAKP